MNTQIIAEIGTNHNGSLATAIELIDVAVDCGADVVKFQSFLADSMYSKNSYEFNMLKKLEMRKEWYPKIMNYCDNKGVSFLSTATNITTIDWMEEYGAKWYKIASGNIDNYQVLDKLIQCNKPVIISTGLTTLDELLEVIQYLHSNSINQITVLYCVSKYPPNPNEINLKNLSVLKDITNCIIGFSDHSLGTHYAVSSVALGAKVIEKHITLDRSQKGPDHHFSLHPHEFMSMTKQIRDIEKSLGVDFKPNYDDMLKYKRSLHYCNAVKAGDYVKLEDIKITRPADGLPSKKLHEIVGRFVIKDVCEDDPVLLDNFII